MGGAHDRRGAEEKKEGGEPRMGGVLKRKEGRGRNQDRRGADEKLGRSQDRRGAGERKVGRIFFLLFSLPSLKEYISRSITIG